MPLATLAEGHIQNDAILVRPIEYRGRTQPAALLRTLATQQMSLALAIPNHLAGSRDLESLGYRFPRFLVSGTSHSFRLTSKDREI